MTMKSLTSTFSRFAGGFALSFAMVATAWAQPKGLDYSVVVANEGADSLGTVQTFAKGARRNAAPEFLHETPSDLSELFSGIAVSPVTHENFVVDSKAGIV